MSTKTILIVDDEEDLRDALAFDFKRQGFEVLLAENGRKAYSILEKNPISIILSDVRMAGGDGVELLINTKRSHIHVPVVLSTGFAEIGIDEAYALGAEAVIFKPFERKYLKEVVNNSLLSLTDKLSMNATVEQAIDQELSLNESDSKTALKIGKKGMSFIWEHSKIKDKTRIRINLTTSKYGTITIYGIVRYVLEGTSANSNRIGCEFVHISGNKKDEFVSFVESLETASSIPK